MSSVIISGDTSGSITIQAPAVSGTNTLTLPSNTGTVITTASTFGGTGPAFSAYASSTQSVSSTTFTKVTLDTENFDTNNNFASSRFTPTVAGYYQINGFLRTNSSVVITNAIVSIYKNGSSYRRGSENSSGKTNSQISVCEVIYMNGSTDYLELYGFIEATSPSFKFDGNDITSCFNGCLVRAA